MKLKYIFYAFVLGLFISACNETNKGTNAIDLEKKVYRQAADLGDFMSAAGCLQKILVIDSTQKNYWDTLANLYYTARSYGSALKTCEKWTSMYPATENILRVKGMSFEVLGAYDSSYEAFDKLYLMNPKTKYLFKSALYELLMGHEKGFEKLEKVRVAKDLATDSVEIFWSEQNYIQYVKLNAALCWLDAAMMIKGGNIAGAKKGLEEAFKLDPNFEMVRYYLQDMAKQQAGARK